VPEPGEAVSGQDDVVDMTAIEEPAGTLATAPTGNASDGAVSASDAATDGAATDDEPKQSGYWERVFNVLGATWIFIVGGLIWLYNADISSRLRTFIVVVAAVVAVLGILGGATWALREKPGVRKATATAMLVGLVVITALVPVIFLGESDRVLLLKLGAITFLALLPGLLYLQFIAAKAETLREEYVLNLHKLGMDTYWNLPPPPRDSMFRARDDDRTADGDERNLYLQKFDAIFGVRVRHGERVVVRRSGGSLLPIGLCTVLLAVGWTLTLQPEPIETQRLLETVTLSGRPVLPSDPLRFAFLGAYLFVIEMLTRRYFQDDLKAGAYLNGTTRILASGILVTALHQVWPEGWSPGQEVAFAFVIGVFPIVGLQAIQSLIALPLKHLVPSLKKEHPLSDLDGLNIWYESRLLEEGIEDMQNLATANIVDVMLRTRVPIDRLVDWIDQAVLDLHVRDGSSQDSDRRVLRRLGIRTATDLEDVLLAAPAPDPGSNGARKIEPDDFLDRMRSVLSAENDTGPSVTVAVWKTLAREPNLFHVRRWKETKRLEQAWQAEETAEVRPEPLRPDAVEMQRLTR
jgi:hypothetical protein